MRRALALVAAAAISAAGCSDDEEGTPDACLEPAGDYVAALRSAPDPVTLDGGTRISACVAAAQDAADLGQVGESVIEAATQLNSAARRDPNGEDTVALGYLVGAVQQGASESGGIHADLVRRLDTAARFTLGGEPPAVGFERAFNEGYAAGQQEG
jgi:hypothetical protein